MMMNRKGRPPKTAGPQQPLEHGYRLGKPDTRSTSAIPRLVSNEEPANRKHSNPAHLLLNTAARTRYPTPDIVSNVQDLGRSTTRPSHMADVSSSHVRAPTARIDERSSSQASSKLATHSSPHLRLNHDEISTSRTGTSAGVALANVSTANTSRSALRRKPSNIDQYSRKARTESKSIQEHRELVNIAHDTYEDPFPGSVLGITLPTTSWQSDSRSMGDYSRSAEDPHRRKRVDAGTPHELSQITTNFRAPSTTPSTRYTDSPFSHLSTPTSMSSYSPHTAASAQRSSRGSQERYLPGLGSKSTPAGGQALESDPKANLTHGRTGPSLPSSPRAFLGQSADVHTLAAQVSPRSKQQHHEQVSPPSSPILRTVPPEFVHLNIDHAQGPARSAPRRPSRDGTPDLSDLQGSFPVIHSDLSPIYTSYHKRTPSQDTTLSTASPRATRSLRHFGFSSRSSSRELTPRVDSVTSPSPVLHRDLKSPVSDTGSAIDSIHRFDSPLVGPSPSPSTSRFGKFLHRDKDSSNKLSGTAKKLRKGPTAGTGHERYGRFGLRGRSSNITGSTTEKRPDSADSTVSKGSSFWSRRGTSPAREDDSDMDDFFKARLSPVTLGGSRGSSGDMESLNSTVASSVTYAAPALDSQYDSSRARTCKEPLADHEGFIRAGLLSKTPGPSGTMPLAIPIGGNSIRKSRTLGSLSAEPDTLNSFEHTKVLALASRNESITTPSRQVQDTIEKYDTVSKANRSGISKANKEQTKPTRRWNFFQRIQAAKEVKAGDEEEAGADYASQNRPSVAKAGPWAMEGNTHRDPLQDLERTISATTISSTQSANLQSLLVATPGPVSYEERHAFLLPSPPVPSVPESSASHTSPTKHLLVRNDSAESPELLKASLARTSNPPQVVSIPRSPILPAFTSLKAPPKRLSPVGRIPQVKSNSRLDQQLTVRQLSASYSARESLNSIHPALRQEHANEEFISFPPRKNSELSFTSSSGAASFKTDSTLIGQPASTQTVWLGDEDVWNEYNDLMDQVLPGKGSKPTELPKTPTSAGSSLGAPFQYDDSSITSRPEAKPLPHIPAMIEGMASPQAVQDSSASGSPYRFSRFLQPAATPTTPYSISDIMAGYSDVNLSARSSTPRQSVPSANRASLGSGYSSHYSRMSGHSRSASRPDADVPELPPLATARFHEEQSVRTGNKDASPRRSADADLRFGALMTSKWLSFGRVLFSPAHNEVKRGGDGIRVLIVDGLGKDWSYYCALTYPNATFYNLDIGNATRKITTRGQDLANYRNVSHTSLTSPFPFPRGFFSTVILRFPVATTEKAYQAATFECKRVLRSGGYLELAVLDLDLMNMGNSMRRALRSLKTDVYNANPSTSLGNLGDIMMTLVGRRGFENIQRCVVGIPAAGKIRRSTDLSSNGSSSERESLHAQTTADDNGLTPQRADFADLLHGNSKDEDTAGRKDNDEGISKMVAKVGRWWYTTCYEAGTGREDSIWDKTGLLRECEKQGTSFRLLLCCAQKPECPKRRTASI